MAESRTVGPGAMVGGSRRAISRAAGALLVLALLSGAWEMPFIPWARSFGLWPTLTGRWVGQAPLPNGRASFVYLDLNGEMPRRSRLTIGGGAQWCEPGSAVQEYVVHGRPDNWRGTRFHLETSSRTEQTRMLSALSGEWQGDEMQATGRVVSYARTATTSEDTAPTSPVQVLRYTLRRGNIATFQQACHQANHSTGKRRDR